MKKFKKVVALLLVLLMAVSVMTACGSEEDDAATPQDLFVEYTSNELGFKINMKAELFGISSFEEQETVFDEEFQMNRTSMLISGVISEVKVPLVTINIFEGEFKAEELETLNPLMVYVGTCEGRTYTLQYSEEGNGLIDDEETMNEYNDIMNNMVVGMENKITLFSPGTLESDEYELTQQPTQFDDETQKMIEQSITPTDLQAE